jgi:hypothetical protein
MKVFEKLADSRYWGLWQYEWAADSPIIVVGHAPGYNCESGNHDTE